MFIALIAALAGTQQIGTEHIQSTAPSTLPPSLRPGALEACAPTTLEAAEKCLESSLSAEDLAIVRDRIPARRFRANLDCEIEKAWRLGDPRSPMAKAMRALLGFDDPSMAAGMIISDIQSRSLGYSVPWDEFRKEFGGKPPAPPSSSCKVKIAPDSQERGDAN